MRGSRIGLSSTLGSSTAGFYSIAHPPPPAPPQQPSSSRLRPISSSPTFMRVGVSHSPVVGLQRKLWWLNFDSFFLTSVCGDRNDL